MLFHNLLPVVSSEDELKIPWNTLKSIVAGKSVVDLNEIHLKTPKEAVSFLQAYGIDPLDPKDQTTLSEIRDHAFDYLRTVILKDQEEWTLPSKYQAFSVLELIVASSNWRSQDGVNWPCALLKVCHAFAHAKWSHDHTAHKLAFIKIKQRMEPYLSTIDHQLWIGDDECKIPLLKLDFKEDKPLYRIATKLLHKPGNLSINILDHLGLRFVVEDVFSSILLVKFLRSRSLFMYANNIPEATKNSLAEIDSIIEMFKQFNPPPYIKTSKSESALVSVGEENPFSSQEFKMIKLVERILVKTPEGERKFFPCEIQIYTRTQLENLTQGTANHDAYEQRQIKAVRDRLIKTT